MTELVLTLNTYFKKKSISNAILRNYEGLPEYTGNDVDWFVEEKVTKELVRKIIPQDWEILSSIEKDGLVQYHFFNSSKSKWLQIDFFDSISYKGFPLISQTELLYESSKHKQFTVISQVADAYISLVTKLLNVSSVKEGDRDKINQALYENEKYFTKLIEKYFGKSNAKKIVSNISRKNWESVNQLSTSLRNYFLRDKRSLGEIKRSVKRVLRTPFPSICILGTDGSGKSTVINGIRKVFPKIKTFHLRPGFIKNISQIGKPASDEPLVVTNPHAKKPHNILISIGMFFYYYIDYTLGFWIKAYPQMIKGNLVIFDRFYYDYYADKKRFRSSLPDWWYRFWEIFIPKPKKFFFLDGTAELFLSRKQEVTKKSLEKQIAVFQKLCRQHKNFISLDASQKPDEIVKEILMNLCSKDYN